ncbi:uncharacterized protein PITG_15259 [Phytophthora infestans T30-4]|uniref:Uncharacterized protein n=1 Tax=Phytophthora infestans (strain T30-4) TaxID=403677 RepID=D0NQA0_PHYIT|nr:uncharacterized protein PITG_15259 [Phytophthora infestans T30-4]EEY62832.1 conserved hypothetical protein [Phytophthora infestans T30-4]|eukprot:XP_002898707.1 conserved hypothetical protein [Phytophthora infestans T30-4]
MESMCLQRMHPWLARNFSCAVVRYNCYKEGVTKIIFMHCSAFTMPPIIREFSSVMGVEIFNSTLVEWGEDAAAPLPEQLSDLEFIHTNLTAIPDSVVEPWKGIEIVYIEHSQLNSFPTALMQLPVLSELSLIDNKIATIPDNAILNAASTYFYNLALSKNPLREPPQARSDNFDVSYLALEFTLLTETPEWINTNVWDAVSLGDKSSWDPLGDERYPTKLMMPFRSLDA